MSSSSSIVLPRVESLLSGFFLLPLHLLGFVSKINKTITIMPLGMPRRPFVVIITDDSFLPHVFDDEKVRARVLKLIEVSIMIGNVPHPLSPIPNTVVWVLEGQGAENADGLWWRVVFEKVRLSMGDIRIDLSWMKA